MKCITNGEVVRRVSDKEAEHYISREGWEYACKKVKVKGFICPKCGKKYTEKPVECTGKITTRKKGKNGEELVIHTDCHNKKFEQGEIFIPAWK